MITYYCLLGFYQQSFNQQRSMARKMIMLEVNLKSYILNWIALPLATAINSK